MSLLQYYIISLKWAKVIMSIERSIPSATCKEHLESYSIKVKLQPVNICSCLQLSTGASWAPRRGVSWSSSPKTRPEPAKGRGRCPTGRWGKENIYRYSWTWTFVQKTGKTVVKYLKKRGISGDDLRREMWVHDEAETPKANRKKKGKGYDISWVDNIL